MHRHLISQSLPLLLFLLVPSVLPEPSPGLEASQSFFMMSLIAMHRTEFC